MDKELNGKNIMFFSCRHLTDEISIYFQIVQQKNWLARKQF